jgi:hypothetical protein
VEGVSEALIYRHFYSALPRIDGSYGTVREHGAFSCAVAGDSHGRPIQGAAASGSFLPNAALVA